MEIKFKNINSDDLENVTFSVCPNELTALIGDEEKESIVKLLSSNSMYTGDVSIDEKVIMSLNNQKIGIIDNENFDSDITLENILKSKLKDRTKYNVEFLEQKIEKTLKIIGLSSKKKYTFDQLSYGEKTLLNIGIGIGSNYDVMIFNDIFDNLDYEANQMLKKLLSLMVKRYNKTIMIISNNVDFVYSFCDRFIFFKGKKIVLDGARDVFINNYETLKDNNLPIPTIVRFKETVLEKTGINLHDRIDIKDLMKDIYRNVR